MILYISGKREAKILKDALFAYLLTDWTTDKEISEKIYSRIQECEEKQDKKKAAQQQAKR